LVCKSCFLNLFKYLTASGLKLTFGKDEKLCSRTIIERLFKKGSTEVISFYLFPFRVLYIIDPDSSKALPQVLCSVSKRSFKRAVDRNLLRRRSKEAYRHQKHLLTQLHGDSRPSYIAFLYLAKEIENYSVIQKGMTRCVQKMISAR
jgi:ribonuclease P protein component